MWNRVQNGLKMKPRTIRFISLDCGNRHCFKVHATIIKVFFFKMKLHENRYFSIFAVFYVPIVGCKFFVIILNVKCEQRELQCSWGYTKYLWALFLTKMQFVRLFMTQWNHHTTFCFTTQFIIYKLTRLDFSRIHSDRVILWSMNWRMILVCAS